MNKEKVQVIKSKGTMNNSYVNQKAKAQGSLTTALLLSNVSLVKTLLQKKECKLQTVCIAGVLLICLSIMLQIVVGVMLVILSRREQYMVKRMKEEDREKEAYIFKHIKEETMADASYQIGPDDDKTSFGIDPVKKEERKRKKRLMYRLNTCVLVLTFLVAIINIIINGLNFNE